MWLKKSNKKNKMRLMKANSPKQRCLALLMIGYNTTSFVFIVCICNGSNRKSTNMEALNCKVTKYGRPR